MAYPSPFISLLKSSFSFYIRPHHAHAVGVPIKHRSKWSRISAIPPMLTSEAKDVGPISMPLQATMAAPYAHRTSPGIARDNGHFASPKHDEKRRVGVLQHTRVSIADGSIRQSLAKEISSTFKRHNTFMAISHSVLVCPNALSFLLNCNWDSYHCIFHQEEASHWLFFPSLAWPPSTPSAFDFSLIFSSLNQSSYFVSIN